MIFEFLDIQNCTSYAEYGFTKCLKAGITNELIKRLPCVAPLTKAFLPPGTPICSDMDTVVKQGEVLGEVFINYAQNPGDYGCSLACERNSYDTVIQPFYGASLGSMLPENGMFVAFSLSSNLKHFHCIDRQRNGVLLLLQNTEH